MPIYEYRCGGCGRKVSLFFPTIAAAETRTAAGENRCPRCDSPDLSRLMSRARSLRSAGSAGDEDSFPEGPGFSDSMSGLGDMDLPDDEDPRAIARWARRMKENMGEDMDLGPEFDRALARIESGEDPDRVMDDLDPEAMGGGGMDGDDDFSDLGGDDD